ncbi:site-specific integrase [Burkholderia pseudomallei]|uniref:site-specific integrase n=1 Tax=Burkholderia pseudomallei TaxID=28450 RepID=UPI000F0785B3|nr:site-specific integrase [Burkholderia pseudomallei]CAJ2765777.1 Phage integrase family [Burkholderia pseudomallei]VCJ20407.1 Phage integrase family [Burkholderia pseudomallei]
MPRSVTLPSISEVLEGRAVFRDDMPVLAGVFGADVWPFFSDSSSPLYLGETTSSITWRDYIEGRGATYNHPSSFQKTKYPYCLTNEIVRDLKIAAVIYVNFPNLIKHARHSKKQLDPKTVKGRMDELAKFFSLAILKAREKLQHPILALADIPFSIVKETIAVFPGRAGHLKRALKLISDPTIQENISARLQWGLTDITRGALPWREDADGGGVPTLSDAQFLYLLDHCKKAIAKFKSLGGLLIHDGDCRALSRSVGTTSNQSHKNVLDGYYRGRGDDARVKALVEEYGLTLSEVRHIIKEAHTSAILIILLFTGMRSTEVRFLMRDCLKFEHGYWFLVSKEVKRRPKDMPITEGWLAIDITRDAYDILMFITEKTRNDYLFSSPWPGKNKGKNGYRGGTLNTLFIRWLKTIDSGDLFATWTFSIHQCRETLVSQLAQQEVGLPFISMQLKHFRSQFNALPNLVTANYGQYRKQLATGISNRLAYARETALLDIYGEQAKFAGGGAVAHKARIDAFFSGLGLFGKQRERYVKDMARRGVKLMPTSIGNCGKNFVIPTENEPPPCYGDFQCDPNCSSHVISPRAGRALIARKNHAVAEAERETNPAYKKVWWGLVETLNGHIATLGPENLDGRAEEMESADD